MAGYFLNLEYHMKDFDNYDYDYYPSAEGAA